ncbi:MAG: FmdB family zinc ribbon protein [Armatimonadota bacterium]|jgi:putative FmdB family regulatory protein
MPLYEYECGGCGERFEALVSAKHRDETRTCPACGGEETELVPSTFAVGVAKAGTQCTGCCPGGTCGL